MHMILILPALLLVGTASESTFVSMMGKLLTDRTSSVAGYGICVELTMLKGSGAIFENGLAPWITSFFSLSLTTNVIATSTLVVLSDRKRLV